MRNLIIGAIRGYDYSQLHNFFASLAKADYAGDVVVFTDSMRGDPAKLPTGAAHHVFLPYTPNSLQVHDHRFVLALDCLVKNPEYAKVMITDVRDVVFQADPFAQPLAPGLSCFLEDSSMTIATCRFNSGWIAHTFGPKVLAEIGHNHISCCGVTIGDYMDMVLYLQRMNSFIYPGRPGPAIGVDTAAHNYIIRKQLMPLNVVANGTGPVLTMGYMRQYDLHDSAVWNSDGSQPAVVHQYDRHAEVAKQFTERFK